jgi:2-dehydro-3-deoxyphosphogluconate aldolase / (4S)-4-hydroxy-2-oxoglutarate aldolase
MLEVYDQAGRGESIKEIGVVPVVRAPSPKHAMLAAEAVCAGGIPIVEVTMTVPGAVEVIAELGKSIGSEGAQHCIHAEAEFVVGPGFNLETVKFVNGLRS